MIDPTVKLTELTVLTSVTSLVAMAFTPSELTAIVIAVGALIATIFTGVVNIIAALRTERKVDRSIEKIGHVIEKTSDVSAKADVIEGHVNSAATASSARIESLTQQVEHLTRLLSEGKQTAAVLAQSKADVAVVAPIAANVEIAKP